MQFTSLLRRPSAIAPLVMSLVALVMVASYAAAYGVVYHEDEGLPARIFQLLIVAQVPFALAFAAKWVPESPKPAVLVLVLQAAAAGAAVGLVLLLESQGL